MTQTTNLSDAKRMAIDRIEQITNELASLDRERGDLSLDVMLGKPGAEQRLKAIGERAASLVQERDGLTHAAGAAERREAEQAKQDQEAQRARLQKQRDKALADLDDLYGQVVALVEQLGAVIPKCLAADDAIAPMTSALGYPPIPYSQQSKAKLLNYLTWKLADAGLRPDIVAPHHTLRVPPTNQL